MFSTMFVSIILSILFFLLKTCHDESRELRINITFICHYYSTWVEIIISILFLAGRDVAPWGLLKELCKLMVTPRFKPLALGCPNLQDMYWYVESWNFFLDFLWRKITPSANRNIKAVIAGFERDDSNYLARLEDEFCWLKKKEEIEQKPLTVECKYG